MAREGSKSGRGGRSSKTARVMNLLTDYEPIAEDSSASGGSGERKRTASDAGAKRTISDENTQDQIRNALEMELADLAESASEAAPAPEEIVFEDKQEEPAAAPEPAQGPLSAADEADTEELTEDSEAHDSKDTEVEDYKEVNEEVTVDTEKEVSIDTEEEIHTDTENEDLEDAENEDNDDDYICFNVTQALVEDKTDKYMKMFGMCTCNRCRIDVIALALSGLPAKYVVARPKDMVPRLSIYEAKYSAAVITQVMKACKKVIDLPHHKR